MINSNLPFPDENMESRMAQISALIRQKIKEQEGWITFAEFMELALYSPGLGYYTGGVAKFGQEGDFVTAPTIGKLFGSTVAHQIAQILDHTPGRQILELGAGDGSAAADIMLTLEKLDALPKSYGILDVSPSTYVMQREILLKKVPHLLHIFDWLSEIPEKLNGVIFANEVFDALPVNLIELTDSGVWEKGVVIQPRGFSWSNRIASQKILTALADLELPVPYTTEIGLVGQALMNRLTKSLEKGVIIVIDYGFRKEEYYHPQRFSGTLMCHYKHRAHQNPFTMIGHQDITSHVDFSRLANVAKNSKLDVIGFCSQAQFLINCGIINLLQKPESKVIQNSLEISAEINKLLSPAEMGELFKVLAIGRDIDFPIIGFSKGNRRELL